MSAKKKRKDYFAELPKSAQAHYEKEMGREGYNEMMWRRDDKAGIGKFLSDEEREEKRKHFERQEQNKRKAQLIKGLIVVSALVIIAYLLASL